jgi:hypothetical protein
MIERIRESISGPLNQAELQTRQAEGWKLVAVEWERERSDVEAAPQPEAEVPFGLKVSGDCAHLEEDSNEREVLVAMMAEELNRRGFRTREGVRWTPVSVFQMLPRLIEVGPKIFQTEEWQRRRERMRM